MKKFKSRPCIRKSTKFIDMVTRLPQIHAKGFGLLEYSVKQMGPFVKVLIHVESGSQFRSQVPPPTGFSIFLGSKFILFLIDDDFLLILGVGQLRLLMKV